MFACVAVVAATASAALAQTADGAAPPLLPAGPVPVVMARPLTAPFVGEADPIARAELTQWMDAFLEYQTWAAEWRGRRERGWLTRFRDRKTKPDPPAWLDERCEAVFDDEDILRPACVLLADWKSDGNAAARSQLAGAAPIAPAEKSDKIVWWEHLHIDALWPALQWQSSVYGIVGTHATATIRGRWQVFLGPGTMLLNLPARGGGRVWKLAANYGVGYRLFEFTFPGGRPAVLHVNLAKAYLLSDPADAATGRTMDFVGFSMTFNRIR